MLARLAFTKFQGLKIFSDNTYQTVFEKINKVQLDSYIVENAEIRYGLSTAGVLYCSKTEGTTGTLTFLEC